MNTHEQIQEEVIVPMYSKVPNNLKSFYQFNGAYSGCITGDVNEECIYDTIRHYDPTANLKDLNMVVIDYDTSVYFIALNMENANLQEFLKTPELTNKTIIFADFNEGYRACDLKDETKPIYEFGTWFTNVIVSKCPPNHNSHGLRIVIDLAEYRDISVSTPTGHVAQWRMSTRFAQRLLNKIANPAVGK